MRSAPLWRLMNKCRDTEEDPHPLYRSFAATPSSPFATNAKAEEGMPAKGQRVVLSEIVGPAPILARGAFP
jgi:hypothetical protein